VAAVLRLIRIIMRDILDDIFASERPDPIEAARRGMRPALRKRFYQAAGVAAAKGGFAVALDDKPVMTPVRRTVAAPTRALAEAIAAEWERQGERVDPATMPLTRLANAIVDAVADAPEAVAAEIANYLGSDLVCYRAEEPQGLVECQVQHWDPLIAFAREELNARFVLAAGIVHVAQTEEALAAACAAIPQDIWPLGALASITTLTGSALIALALARGALSAEAAWAAAHVDEDWQMAQWGRDEVALARRAFREAEFKAAATVLALA
jgi:chaperone required for assembly of F1-ATPase